ncbi:MAG: response regulator [Steroidobacteraceae bacterium]
MTARRALVVDDSKSARAFLARILERYELTVDGVESAEQAIDYLTHQQPDVIFMDHLMPGMDGFQAVQAIKNNPRTATIPIMMYTSQEGELYLSQARALGAIGVLPKHTKHTDVTRALEQLNLLGPSRLDDEIILASPAPEADSAAVAAAAEISASSAAASGASSAPTARPSVPGARDMSAQAPQIAAEREPLAERRSRTTRPDLPPIAPELRTIIDAMVSHHMLELRRFLVDNLESQSDRIIADVRVLLGDEPPESALVPPPRAGQWGLWLGLAALIFAALVGLQWQQQRGAALALTGQLAQTQQQLASTQHSLQTLQDMQAAGAAAVANEEDASGAGAPNDELIEPVPFGETPLAGSRLERIQGLLARLTAQGFHGSVQIRSIPGRYCMNTPPTAQPIMAADNMPYTRCDSVGNPREDNGSVSLRQSVAFANMIATARENSKGALDLQISAGTSDETITPYPPISEGLTAGEWNRVAAANNRVEVHWQPVR